VQKEIFVKERKEQNLDRAMRRDVSLRGAVSLFQFTYSKPNDRDNISRIRNAVRNVIKTKYAGHPKVFSVGGKTRFVWQVEGFSKKGIRLNSREVP
jgi:hypothetical protein